MGFEGSVNVDDVATAIDPWRFEPADLNSRTRSIFDVLVEASKVVCPHKVVQFEC